MKMSQKGMDLIKEFEGFKAWAYLCPAGVWTIGYGTTRNVKKGQTVTPSQAMALLVEDVKKFENDVNNYVKVPLTQNQFDALVCFAYNVGSGNLKTSTLLKLVNTKDFAGAAAQFVRWNKADGRTLAGLTRRREAEAKLFQTK
jgi:lysozyme